MGKVTIRTKKSFEFNETALYVIANAISGYCAKDSNRLTDLMKELLIKHYDDKDKYDIECTFTGAILDILESRGFYTGENEHTDDSTDNHDDHPTNVIYDHVFEDMPESTTLKKSNEKKLIHFD